MPNTIPIPETRDYRRVWNRLSNAYDGGGSFGVDLRTISPGWRQALARVGMVDPSTPATITPEPDAYALLCGAVWRYERGDFSIQLWQECPGNTLIHVRATDWSKGGRQYWDTYETITDAKRAFRDGIANS